VIVCEGAIRSGLRIGGGRGYLDDEGAPEGGFALGRYLALYIIQRVAAIGVEVWMVERPGLWQPVLQFLVIVL
jgi:hypothetical protein